MKTIRILFHIIFVISLMTGCLLEDPMKQPYTGFDPADIGDGWVISTPSAEQIDSLALDRIYKDVYADDDTWMTKSLLVFRHRKLIAESYLKTDEDRTRIDAIWSCTKQVNSIITGIAIDQGYIGSVTDPVSDYLPEYIEKYPDKASLTLENLLMMGSGVAFDNSTQSDVFRKHQTDNSIDYVLGLDLMFEPGTGYNYNDGDPQVVSGIVQAATGKTLDEYGKEVLFDPLGITNYEWVRYSDGITMGGFGTSALHQLDDLVRGHVDEAVAHGIIQAEAGARRKVDRPGRAQRRFCPRVDFLDVKSAPPSGFGEEIN